MVGCTGQCSKLSLIEKTSSYNYCNKCSYYSAGSKYILISLYTLASIV